MRSAGSGQPTSAFRIADELETNPFLRWDAPGVINNLSAKEKLSGSDSDDVFAACDSGKTPFDELVLIRSYPEILSNSAIIRSRCKKSTGIENTVTS